LVHFVPISYRRPAPKRASLDADTGCDKSGRRISYRSGNRAATEFVPPRDHRATRPPWCMAGRLGPGGTPRPRGADFAPLVPFVPISYHGPNPKPASLDAGTSCAGSSRRISYRSGSRPATGFGRGPGRRTAVGSFDAAGRRPRSIREDSRSGRHDGTDGPLRAWPRPSRRRGSVPTAVWSSSDARARSPAAPRRGMPVGLGRPLAPSSAGEAHRRLRHNRRGRRDGRSTSMVARARVSRSGRSRSC
jgi:hypothetical protein